jgi:hypothetical protein
VPFLVIDRIEYGPPEFAELLPLRCELVRPVPGPEGADYFLVRPEPAPTYFPLAPSPITPELDEHYTRNVYPRLESFDLAQVKRELLQYLPDGRIAVVIPGFIVTPRYPPARIGPDMLDTWVNLAFVLDPAAMRGPGPDFGTLYFAAIARMTPEPAQAEPAPEQTPAPATRATPGSPDSGSGPVRYLEFADRMGERAGYVWIGVNDDRSGVILPQRPYPETAATARAWIAALRADRDGGVQPESTLARLREETADILAGALVPTAIAEAPSLLPFAQSAGRELTELNRRRADTVGYGMPPREFTTLMVPTPAEQERIDTMLAEAIRARDAIPEPDRVLNANPKFNTNFGPASAEIDHTPPAIGEQAR